MCSGSFCGDGIVEFAGKRIPRAGVGECATGAGEATGAGDVRVLGGRAGSVCEVCGWGGEYRAVHPVLGEDRGVFADAGCAAGDGGSGGRNASEWDGSGGVVRPKFGKLSPVSRIRFRAT